MELFATILYAAAIISTGILLLTKRCGPKPEELFRIHETPLTAALGAALWAEAGIVLYFLFTHPERLAPSAQSKLNAYIFLFASAVLGCGMILYSFVKVILVFDDRVTYISIFGSDSTLKWNEIDEVKATQSKRLTLYQKDGIHFTVGGKPAPYHRFIKLACKKIPPEAGEDILASLKTAFKL
jgi:hypothetical protein